MKYEGGGFLTCPICGLWLFPQDKHGLACSSGERAAARRGEGA